VGTEGQRTFERSGAAKGGGKVGAKPGLKSSTKMTGKEKAAEGYLCPMPPLTKPPVKHELGQGPLCRGVQKGGGRKYVKGGGVLTGW